MSDFYQHYFAELSSRLHDAGADELDALANIFSSAAGRGRKVLLAGNGASAAIASHVAVDLTKTCSVRAITFNEPDLITCFANDYGFEHWIARALDAYGDQGDVAVLISSSGRSPNVLNAAARARERDLEVVTLSGFDADNPLRQRGSLNLWVNSHSYNVVETTHQSWLLAVTDHLARTRGGA